MHAYNICIERGGGESDFRELTHVIVEAGKSQICRAGRLTGDQGLILQHRQAGILQAEFPLMDLIRPTHIMKGNVLY